MSNDETSHDTASCNLLGAPAPASARARIIALSKAWSEERAVRNWNEGLVGELTPELQTLVECMREAEANQISALVDDGLCDALLGRLRQCPPAVERDWIKRALIAAYAACQSQRSSMRLAFGSEVDAYRQAPRWRWAIAPVLGVLQAVLYALSERRDAALAAPAAGALLERALLPLWLPSEFAEWRDQLPLIGSYATELQGCCLGVIRISPLHGADLVFGGAVNFFYDNRSRQQRLVFTKRQV